MQAPVVLNRQQWLIWSAACQKSYVKEKVILHNIYPWQEKQWLQLSKLLEQERLPHAILLNGPKDLGKRTFAIALAERLFCLSPLEKKACGICQGCYLMHSATHPDFYLVEVDKSKVIKIEQIREL